MTEAYVRQLLHKEQYLGAVNDFQQEVEMFKRSLANSQVCSGA